MAKFLRTLCKPIKRSLVQTGVSGTVISFSTVVAFQEQNLEKPSSEINFENMKEKWSHKYLLQQSRSPGDSCDLNVKDINIFYSD